MTGTRLQVCLDASGDEHITCSHMRIDFALKLTECHSEVEIKVV